jgi:hypothetical protein
MNTVPYISDARFEHSKNYEKNMLTLINIQSCILNFNFNNIKNSSC